MERLKAKGMDKRELAIAAGGLVLLLAILPPGGLSALSWETGFRWFYISFIAFFASILLGPVSVELARRTGAMDRPDARKVHTIPTPRIGGVAVYLAFIFAVWRNQVFTPQLWGLLAGGTIIFLLGLADDMRGLPATFRLFVQLAAASLVAACGIRIEFLLAWPGGQVAAFVLSVLWLVGVTNAFNFLDGIDGLACALGITSALFTMGLAAASAQPALAVLSAALAGACLGFFRLNWHPAKAFLGDCGSTFIGFMLAGFALLGGSPAHNNLTAIATPVLVLGIPIFDIGYITVARIRRGAVRTVKQWLEYVGKDHFHHRLMKLGFSVQESVGFIVLLNICLGLAAWTIHYTQTGLGTTLLLFQAFLIFSLVVMLMLKGRTLTGDSKR